MNHVQWESGMQLFLPFSLHKVTMILWFYEHILVGILEVWFLRHPQEQKCHNVGFSAMHSCSLSSLDTQSSLAMAGWTKPVVFCLPRKQWHYFKLKSRLLRGSFSISAKFFMQSWVSACELEILWPNLLKHLKSHLSGDLKTFQLQLMNTVTVLMAVQGYE